MQGLQAEIRQGYERILPAQSRSDQRLGLLQLRGKRGVMTHMTEYIDKTEAMRRFKPFGREIPKEQVMAVLARIDEGIVRCKDCRHRIHDEERCLYYCEMYYGQGDVSDDNFCQWGAKMDGDMSDGERSEE